MMLQTHAAVTLPFDYRATAQRALFDLKKSRAFNMILQFPIRNWEGPIYRPWSGRQAQS